MDAAMERLPIDEGLRRSHLAVPLDRAGTSAAAFLEARGIA
jgi:hypothetical protein